MSAFIANRHTLTVFQFLAKQQEKQDAQRIRLLTIWFGCNDACLPGSRQHVPLTSFATNLATLIQMVRSPESPYYSPITKIILINPPPINSFQIGPCLLDKVNPTLPPKYRFDWSFKVTKAYAEEVLKVGEKENVPVVDVWTRIWEAAGKNESSLETFLFDGLHLNEAGYQVS